MKSRYHTYYTQNGFKYTEGRGCGCKSYYAKGIEDRAIVIQVSRCRSGRPHVRCPWEWIYAINGQIIEQQPEGSIQEFEQFVNETPNFKANGVKVN